MSIYPKNCEEWWASFDENKDALRELVFEYHPGYPKSRRQSALPITADWTERVCEDVRKDIAAETIEDPAFVFDKASQERDGRTLLKLLNETWLGVPESRGAHRLAGFGVLCDLCRCSEGGSCLELEFEEDGEEGS